MQNVHDFKLNDLVTSDNWGPSTRFRVVGFSRKRVAVVPGGMSVNEPMCDVVDVVMVDDANFTGSYLPHRLTKIEES